MTYCSIRCGPIAVTIVRVVVVCVAVVRSAVVHRAVVCVLVGYPAVFALAGCDYQKQRDVPAIVEADVNQQVQRYADQVAALIGNTSLRDPVLNSAPCGGRRGELAEDIRYVQGAYQLPLPAEQHLITLARVRDVWRNQGWTITKDRTYADDRSGTLTSRNPDDGYSVSLTSTTPPMALALLIYSDCYRTPTNA